MTAGEAPRALLITGTVGVGKTTVAEAVGDLLGDAGVSNAVIDVDWLRRARPAPAGDRFHMALAMRNLRAVAANYLDAGVRRLVLAGVVESPDDRERHQRAVGLPMTVCRLRADLPLVRARLARRHEHEETAREWHLHRAGELDALLEAAVVEDCSLDVTTATPTEAAAAVVRAVGWETAGSAPRDGVQQRRV
ncbi:MAG: AAA family ATPase [Nocardioidaceae bacterium]